MPNFRHNVEYCIYSEYSKDSTDPTVKVWPLSVTAYDGLSYDIKVTHPKVSDVQPATKTDYVYRDNNVTISIVGAQAGSKIKVTDTVANSERIITVGANGNGVYSFTMPAKAMSFTVERYCTASASAITYGQSLNDSVLTVENAPYDGHWEWDDPDITPSVSDSNNTSYAVSYIPDDDNNAVIHSTTKLEVKKFSPNIVADDITVSDITYGNTLADSIITCDLPQLNGADVAGSFGWENDAVAPNAGTPSYNIVFTPVDTANIETIMISKQVTVNKAPVVIDDDMRATVSATGIIYEQTLADSNLSGDVPRPGHYEWKNPSIVPTVADSNTTPFDVVFIPDDPNYADVDLTCTLTVSKKSHTFSDQDIANLSTADLTYGQTLSESIISGPTPVDGSYRWINGAIVPTVLGTNNFAIEFVPTDTDNYAIVPVGDLHVTVNKADPIITAEQLAAMTVSEITYGQTLADSTITATSTTPGSFVWSDNTISPAVANSLNTDYEITFTPDDTVNYKVKKIYKTVKVNPAPIILSEAIKQSVTATGIIYEQTLADSVLSGDVPQAGHYEWVDNTIAPSVADSNATAYDVVFVPDDENYANAALTCTLMVSKKAFTFTQSDIDNLSASDLTYGQTLSQSIISGDKPVDGSYRWVNGSTVPTVNGTNNFAVEFVPADTDNYEVSSVGDIHVTVNKAEPIVTTEQINAMTVSEITYGQTLADSIITATSTTPGTFEWNDNSIAPTVADSLTTEYNILFTPNDTDNYTTKLIAKTIKVNKATPTVPEDIATSISATGIKFGETLNDSTLSYTGSGTLTGNLSWTNPETVPAMADSDVIAYDVTYTPVDTVNYNTLAYTATVHVDKGEAPSSLQDFSTTVSTDVSEDSSGISTENADGSITIDLSELLGIPGVSGIIKDVSDPNNMFDETPVITDGTKLTYKTNPVPTDTTGTITITVSSRDYEDFDIEITIKATNCPHEHVTNKVGYRAATCSTKGYTGDTVCNDCGCTIAYGQDIATTSHTPIVKNRVAPTCTSEGYSGDVYCKDCGVFVASGRILATTEHTEGEPVVTKPATYDAEGEQRYYCKDCNAYICSEAVPKLSLDGHEHVWVSGYGHDDCDHWKECTECHYLFDKAAHNFNDGDFITATCTTEGSVKYICTVCGYEVTKIETPGHRPVWRYDEYGDKHYKQCKVCGKVFESEVHAYGHWVETVTPTDSKLGTYVRSCTECGYIETVQSAANPEISSNTGGGETGQNNDLLNGGQTGSGKNPDTGIEFEVVKFAALALVAGATILLSRRCKI